MLDLLLHHLYINRNKFYLLQQILFWVFPNAKYCCLYSTGFNRWARSYLSIYLFRNTKGKHCTPIWKVQKLSNKDITWTIGQISSGTICPNPVRALSVLRQVIPFQTLTGFLEIIIYCPGSQISISCITSIFFVVTLTGEGQLHRLGHGIEKCGKNIQIQQEQWTRIKVLVAFICKKSWFTLTTKIEG